MRHAGFSVGAAIFAAAILGAGPAAADGPFLESSSRHGFAKTVAELQAALKRRGWAILKVHDLQASMKKRGHAVLPVKVFAACNPSYAKQVLADDDARAAAALMPCRIAVYAKQDGKTYVSRPNVKRMLGAAKGAMRAAMEGAANEIEEILAPLLRR